MAEREPGYLLFIPDRFITELTAASMKEALERARYSRFANIRCRYEGEYYEYQADWLKYAEVVSEPSPATPEQRRG